MLIEDIMTKEVISVNLSTKITEVANLLHEKRIHALPVVDGGKKVIGIIAETDFFLKELSNAYLPAYIQYNKRAGGAESTEEEKKVAEKVAGTEAKDIMTANPVTIKADAKISEAMTIIKEKNFFSLPVVDDDGVLVGIITIADIIKLI